jgi:hypothetical protein
MVCTWHRYCPCCAINPSSDGRSGAFAVHTFHPLFGFACSLSLALLLPHQACTRITTFSNRSSHTEPIPARCYNPTFARPLLPIHPNCRHSQLFTFSSLSAQASEGSTVKPRSLYYTIIQFQLSLPRRPTRKSKGGSYDINLSFCFSSPPPIGQSNKSSTCDSRASLRIYLYKYQYGE